MSTAELRSQNDAHLSVVGLEIRVYRKRTKLAKGQPDEYMSLAIDGAHQTKFSLAWFVTPTKDQHGHCWKIHLITVLDHAPFCHPRLFTMNNNRATGANHVLEAVHVVINGKARARKLPRNLFFSTLQLQPREIKQVFMEYM